MNHTLTRLKKLLPGFNRKVYGETEFWHIVKAERIHTDFWDLPQGVKGFYGVNSKYRRVYRYLVIDEKLRTSGRWLDTGFHEIIHHFLHVPQSSLEVFYSKTDCNTREEREADRYSLMMKIPRTLFLEIYNTPFDELGMFSRKELRERKRIFDLWGE